MRQERDRLSGGLHKPDQAAEIPAIEVSEPIEVTESNKQEKRKENKVREPDLELWHQRHEQLLQDAEMDRIGRELRAARRRASSRSGAPGGGLAGWIADKILAAPRVSGEKGTKFRFRLWKRHFGCS